MTELYEWYMKNLYRIDYKFPEFSGIYHRLLYKYVEMKLKLEGNHKQLGDNT